MTNLTLDEPAAHLPALGPDHHRPRNPATTADVAQGGGPWPWRQWFWRALIVLAVARVAIAIFSALTTDRGDFFATMPGGIVRTLNPVLWSSPDLETSWAFQRDVYLYGPTQFLLMLPFLAFVDSYTELARVLLVVYVGVIALTIYGLTRICRRLQPEARHVGLSLFVMTAFFFPLHRAFLQREFEVATLPFLTFGLGMILARRKVGAGISVGYIAWFKGADLVWLAYFALRRWWLGLAAFLAASVATVAVGAAVFGTHVLDSVIEVALAQFGRRATADSVCAEWTDPALHFTASHNTTWADAGWALCSLGDRWPWLPVPTLYIGLLGLLGGLFLAGLWRMSRGGELAARDEMWRRALEIGLIITASRTLVHAHYYYMSALLLPLGLLLIRYLHAPARAPWRLGVWLGAYMSISAFGVPVTAASAVFGFDVWAAYMHNTLYLPGQLMLFGLLFFEYLTIPAVAKAAVQRQAA